MPKLCCHEGCNFNRFGGDFCRIHQYLRPKPIKRNSVQPNRYPGAKAFCKKTGKKKRIKKVSEKQVVKNKKKAKLRKRDRELWAEIWDEREHVDFETREPIYGEPLSLYFHHVLPKSTFLKYRFKKWNIILVSWETHSNAENNIDLVPKIKAYREQLIKIYVNETKSV